MATSKKKKRVQKRQQIAMAQMVRLGDQMATIKEEIWQDLNERQKGLFGKNLKADYQKLEK
jgi:hypothetical protein